MSVIDIVSVVLLGLGGLTMLIGAVGVVRFPDFFTRLHAAGKGDTLGQALVLLGLGLPMLGAGYEQILLKLLLIIFFVFIFNPTATHALARGAWVIGLEPWRAPLDEPQGSGPDESRPEESESKESESKEGEEQGAGPAEAGEVD